MLAHAIFRFPATSRFKNTLGWTERKRSAETMKKFLLLLSLMMLSGVAAFAQNGTPDPGEVALDASLDLSIHSVMNVLGGVFYTYVRAPLDRAAVALFVVTLAQAGLQSFTRYSIINLEW